MSRRGALGIAALIAAFLVLSWSDGHYWDEYYYLYSVLYHSPAELLRFETQTRHFPVGFFSEKLGHVLLLDLLDQSPWQRRRALHAVQALYAVFVVGFVGAAYGLMRELLADSRAEDSAVVLMFSPLALYLSFKAMSEVPGLLFITLGSWAFVRSFRPDPRSIQHRWLVLATLGLAVGMLCRVTMIVSFAGLGLALLLAGDERFKRQRLFRRLVVVGVTVVALHVAVVHFSGGSVLHTGAHIQSVVTDHPPLQRAYALVLFLQTFALLLPFAWGARSPGRPWLGLVWLVAAALPFLVGHEPRYYAPALVPLAMVAAAGLRGAAAVLFPVRWRYGWVALLAGLVLFDRVVLIPLMPYEVSQSKLLTVFEEFHRRDPRATYLVPWTSDYSLLRFVFPSANIVLCLTGSPGSRQGMRGDRGPLSAPDQWWAGANHYVGTDSALVGRAEPWSALGGTATLPHSSCSGCWDTSVWAP